MRRWGPRVAVVAAVVVVAAGHTPWIAQLAPWFRFPAHRGLDVAGRVGADTLAAAPGRVTVARDSGGLCGLIVAIDHEPHGYPWR